VTVSVLILALNEESQVADAVFSASAPGVEVVVVDGGSTDATCERAEAAGARVVDLGGSEAGRARQMAVGVRNSRGEIVLFLHADTRLPAGFDSEVERVLSDRSTVGGAFGFRFDQRGAALRFVEWGVRLRVAIFGLPYGDQALFVRRSVLDEIGGVPQTQIMEDLDLVRAMRRVGRVAQIGLPVVTSARRYVRRGVFRTMFRNWWVASGWVLGIDRGRLARWYRQ
jgi:rSAM/selenodomain-associated transferase 2